MENLLAFIEFTQFQIYVKEKLENIEQESPSSKQSVLISFADNIPLSLILTENQSDDILQDLKIKAHNIYNKYIAVGSALEINISWEMRVKMIGILDDLELLISMNSIKIKDLFLIFDECKMEVWSLMLGSFFRFKSESKSNSPKQETELTKVHSTEQSGIHVMTSSTNSISTP